MPFELPTLKYKYDELEPYIDTKTMEIHHSKHHATYTNNLNVTLEKFPNLQNLKIEELLSHPDSLPQESKTAIINNGGGFYNHSFFWEIIGPKGNNKPNRKLLKLIENTFTSFEEFKNIFSKEALTRFGSGWAWLVLDKDKNLKILSTANQDCPLSNGLKPLLNLDVWEHAYYLKYQNRRAEYIENWWNVVNWDEVEDKLV